MQWFRRGALGRFCPVLTLSSIIAMDKRQQGTFPPLQTTTHLEIVIVLHCTTLPGKGCKDAISFALLNETTEATYLILGNTNSSKFLVVAFSGFSLGLPNT